MYGRFFSDRVIMFRLNKYLNIMLLGHFWLNIKYKRHKLTQFICLFCISMKWKKKLIKQMISENELTAFILNCKDFILVLLLWWFIAIIISCIVIICLWRWFKISGRLPFLLVILFNICGADAGKQTGNICLKRTFATNWKRCHFYDVNHTPQTNTEPSLCHNAESAALRPVW